MAEIWRTRDRFGREVVFSSESLAHILDRHDDMTERLHVVRPTIDRATVITRDLTYRRRENYYWRISSERDWIKVVVQYRPAPPQGTWEGEVITAFRVKRPDPREEPREL